MHKEYTVYTLHLNITLHETNISHIGKKKNHLQTCLLRGIYYSSSLEATQIDIAINPAFWTRGSQSIQVFLFQQAMGDSGHTTQG